MHQAPRHLSPQARKFWKGVVREYSIDDVAGLLLLTTACEAFDFMKAAQAEIDRDGMTILTGSGGLKNHPLTTVVRDSRAAMLAALKALNLDLEPLRDAPGRPPGS